MSEIEGLGGNLERVPLRNQAQAVLIFLAAAQEALESAKAAAEGMDAEQSQPFTRVLSQPAKLLMATRHGCKQAVAAWTSAIDQLPALYSPVDPSEQPDGPKVGSTYEAPAAACTACGGRRRLWSRVKDLLVACARCGGRGIERS